MRYWVAGERVPVTLLPRVLFHTSSTGRPLVGGEHDHPGDGILLRGVAADDACDEHVGDHAEDFGDDVAGDQHGGASPAGEVGKP